MCVVYAECVNASHDIYHFLGGGPAPKYDPLSELVLEVMAREAVEGIRGREREHDPLDNSEAPLDLSQSQVSSAASSQSHWSMTKSLYVQKNFLRLKKKNKK